MKHEEFKDSAFAYVDGGVALLRHHKASVRDGLEHDTVDPMALMMALEFVNLIPINGPDSEMKREAVRQHLQAHANVVFYSNPDVESLPLALKDIVRDYAFFKGSLAGTSEVPSVTTEAKGVVYAMLNKITSELSWFSYHVGLSGPETAAHFHVGKSGKVGDIVIPVPVGNPKSGSVVLSKEQVEELFKCDVFFNVHSSNFPDGEIRGQLFPAAVSRSNNSLDSKETLPADTEVRPGIEQAARVPGDDRNEDGQLQPPKERDPNPQTRTLHQQGEKGAVYAEMDGEVKHDDCEGRGKDKKSKKRKKKTWPPGTYAGRVDFAQPLINVVVDPDQQPVSAETVEKIRENDTPTGESPPPAISESSIDAPENAGLKKAIESAMSEGLPRPGEGSIKLRDRVVSFMSSIGFRGRVVLFPVKGSADDYLVVKVQAAPKTTKSINDLPDSSFAVIERGGKKDESGKTAPRNYRHLPYKDASGSIDLPHLRNALARMNQVQANSPKDSTSRIRRVASRVLVAAAKKHLPNSKFAEGSVFYLPEVSAEVNAAFAKALTSGEIGLVEAQLEVEEMASRKVFHLKMGDSKSPMGMMLTVRYDGKGKPTGVQFDYDSHVPAEALPDLAKFLKSLKSE